MQHTSESLPSARRWVLVLLLSLGMVVAYVDRINFSVALAVDDFRNFFALSDADRGFLNSAFFWSYAIAQVPAGWVVDRYGSKYPFACGFFFWSIVSASTAFASSVRHLFLVRLLLGFSEAIVTPASMRWIRFHFAESQRGFALGIYTTGSKVGSAVAAPLTALLMQRYGWRGMFLVLGLGCLLWLVPWLTLAKDDRTNREEESRPNENLPGMSLARLMASPAMWGIIVGAFCYSYFYLFYMTWLPSYFLEHRRLSLDEMGLFTAASFTGMALVAAPAGWWADRIIARGADAVTVRRNFTIAGMLIGCTEVLGAFSSSNTAALTFAVISMAGLGLTTANYWALTQALVPRSAIGRVIGLQNCANSIAGIAASVITGWLKSLTGGYEAPMIAIAVFLLIGVAAYHVLARERFSPAVYAGARAAALPAK